MNNKYVDIINETLYSITQKYDEAIDLLDTLGFKYIRDKKQRETFGKNITLKAALKSKNIDKDEFIIELEKLIANNKSKIEDEIYVEGILPCPIRVPLMEAFEEWLNNNKKTLDFKVKYKLKAASLGVDWLKKSISESTSEEILPDIFISAGFDLFFDERLIGKYKDKKIFEDLTNSENYNKDFDNNYIDLKDPDRQYSMLGVVPAVFLVNTEQLNGLKIPTSWKDLLSGDYENKVSLPTGDLDLFNAVLLNINKCYGKEGVKKLGRSLLKSMHPSEMVKSNIRKRDKPVVTIMPYFFTKMIKQDGPMQAIWPKDGAIVSPIFLLSKKSKADKLKKIVEFFASKKVGEILAHNGKFPSVNIEVDNRISNENKYMWLGWDYINNNDIGNLIEECKKIFEDSLKEE